MSQKISISKRLWVEIEGSIYVKEEDEVITDFSKRRLKVQHAIAFNVGTELAHYIVKLHNDSILSPLLGPWSIK